MKFYFDVGFSKKMWQGIVCLAVALYASVVAAQSETNTQEAAEQPITPQTNITPEPSRTVKLEDLSFLVPNETTKSEEISSQTRLAIAALTDGVFPTAISIARKELNKCEDFSSLNAEILFNIVMLVNKSDILGEQRCLELLDSNEEFGQLWGSAFVSKAPDAFAQSVVFWKACCLADMNKRSEAIALLRGLVNENKFNHDFLKVEVLRRLCYELVLAGELEEAAIYYATKDLPSISDPLCGEAVALFRLAHAQVLFQLNKPVEAELVLKQLISDSNVDPSLTATAYLMNMELLLANDQPSNAVELFEEINRDELFEEATPRVEALLLCKYAQALALVHGAESDTVDDAIADANSAVDDVYFSEERMICVETLINVLASVKRFDEVKIRLTSLLEYAPNSLYVARILRQVARGYQASGEYEQAYWAYQLYLHSFTENPFEYDVMIDSGDCLVQLEKTNEAALQFKRASEFSIEPGKKNLANFKAGEAYYKSGRYIQAAECFAALIPGVKTQEELIVSGQLYHAQAMERFDLPSAKQIYKQLATSENVVLKESALIAIAALSVNDGELTQALEYYTKLVELSSVANRDSYALGLLGRGLVELRTSRYADALNSFKLAENVENGGEFSVRAAFLKTEALYSLGQETAAYSNTVTFLEQFPESPLVVDANFWLAKYDFNSHNYGQAEQRFLEFCNKWSDSPQAPVAHLLAIYAMMEQEKYADVIVHTAQWADAHSNNELLADVQFINGEARCKLLQFDLAAHSYAQAIKNAKSDELRLRATMRKADCFYTLGADNPSRYDEAIAIYKELMLTQNQHRSIIIQMAYKLAKCYEKQGQVENAINCYYVDIILQVEDWAKEANNINVVNYLQAIGGSIWYARAIIDVAALYEKQATPESLKSAEALLSRLVGTQLPCADEAEMSLARINGLSVKQLISNEKSF